MPVFPAHEFYACGDHAFTLDFGQQIDAGINRCIIALFQQLQKQQYPFVLDIIPAYSSITIVYDALFLMQQQISPEKMIHQCFTDAIREAEKMQVAESGCVIRIPVCYHPSLAPDLEDVCRQQNIDIETLIALHTQKTYRVFMNGFLPGFAYLGTVDERIVLPRHSTPRKKVPAGSVGIAGHQTGIYPFESPGGWQLIGRTRLSLFNPEDEHPCLLKPGDEVVFYAVPIETFQS